MSLNDTPIISGLIETVQHLHLPLHVPGHKQGRMLPRTVSQWLGAAAKIDLTELPGLDNLHAPTGCILASEQLAAEHYGSQRCLYSVNGSSAAIVAAIMAVAPGRTVLFANPFHLSAWRGLVLADAVPAFGRFDFDASRLVTKAATAQDVRTVLQKQPDVAAVFLTSPTYAGVTSDVRAIAEVCHSFSIPLIVDEAHGAHFGLAPGLPPSSVRCGADIVIQSVHKMLPALTQTAWVHVQGQRVDAGQLEESMRAVQTTSPSYLLLASLDAAQAWLRTEGAAAAEKTLEVLSANGLGKPAGCMDDPLRHWIPTGDLAVSEHIQAILADSGMLVEYADAMGVLSIFGLGTTEAEVQRYLSALHKAGWKADAAVPVAANEMSAGRWVTGELAVRPRVAFFSPVDWVSVEESEGRMAARMITPYPPGVPVLYPGQRIEPFHTRMLLELSRHPQAVHGFDERGKIAVLSGQSNA